MQKYFLYKIFCLLFHMLFYKGILHIANAYLIR